MIIALHRISICVLLSCTALESRAVVVERLALTCLGLGRMVYKRPRAELLWAGESLETEVGKESSLLEIDRTPVFLPLLSRSGCVEK